MEPIINDQRSRNKLILFIEKLITIICTILLWYFLLKHIFSQLAMNNYYKTIETFKFLLLVSLIIFILMFAWQFYNYHMFASLERRKSRGQATDYVVATMLNIDVNALPLLRAAKYIKLSKVGKISYYFNDDIINSIQMQLIPNSEVDFSSFNDSIHNDNYKIKIK